MMLRRPAGVLRPLRVEPRRPRSPIGCFDDGLAVDEVERVGGIPSLIARSRPSRSSHGSVRQAKFLVGIGDLLHAIDRLLTPLPVGKDVHRIQPPVRADQVSRNRALVDQPHDVGARHAEDVGGLLRSHLVVGCYHVQGTAACEVVE